MDMDTKDTITDFISKNFQHNGESIVIRDNDSLMEKGLIDSTGVLELVLFIEETFGFRVEDEELIPENLDSINRLITYIKSKNHSR
jgi:acyl carrier protein